MIDNNNNLLINGTKVIEIPYLLRNLENTNNNDSFLIIGERSGEEGILWGVLNRADESDRIVLIDLNEVAPNSYVEECLRKKKNIEFIQGDFLEFKNEERFDYIACVNVLEHFGMCWGGKSAIIDWNKDLDAIKHMISLFKKKIIITVPAGPPVFHGDCLENGLPFLKRYDKQRMNIIHSLVKKNNCKITDEHFFYSPTLNNDWKRINNCSDAFKEGFAHYQRNTPNLLWLFCIEHE